MAKRSFWTFSLRDLIWATLLASVISGCYVHRRQMNIHWIAVQVRNRQEFDSEVQKLGATSKRHLPEVGEQLNSVRESRKEQEDRLSELTRELERMQQQLRAKRVLRGQIDRTNASDKSD